MGRNKSEDGKGRGPDSLVCDMEGKEYTEYMLSRHGMDVTLPLNIRLSDASALAVEADEVIRSCSSIQSEETESRYEERMEAYRKVGEQADWDVNDAWADEG